MGLGVAWRLAQRGLRVTVLEKHTPGSGASRAAAGMLAPVAELEFHEAELTAFALASQRRWPSFVQELERDAGMGIEFETTGTLMVAWDRDEAEDLQRHYAYQKGLGFGVDWLSGRALRKIEPMLSPRLVGGVHCPDDVQVSNRCLAKALERACVAQSVTIRTGVEVARVLVDDAQSAQPRAVGVSLASGEELRADEVVIAGGAWSRSLGLEGLIALPIRPVKGQMMALQMDVANPLVRHVIRRQGIYLVPKADGSLVVGATSEEMGFDTRITAWGLRTLLEGAWEILPGIDELPVKETWTGFRPASRDGGPLLGRTDVHNVSVITGHYRNGIQQSPLSIDVVSASILGEAYDESAYPFAATRFSSLSKVSS